MKNIEITANAFRDALTNELFAVAYIDCGDAHGTVMLTVLNPKYIIILTDSPLHEEDVEFDDLPSALRYYRRAKERVIHAVEAWAAN